MTTGQGGSNQEIEEQRAKRMRALCHGNRYQVTGSVLSSGYTDTSKTYAVNSFPGSKGHGVIVMKCCMVL